MNMGQQKHVKCSGCDATLLLSSENWQAELKGHEWTLRRVSIAYCKSCSNDRVGGSITQTDKAYRRLAERGARRSLVPGQVLYERKPVATGVKDERLTWLNYANDTRYIMSARLSIDDGLRTVGNLYGGSVQLAEHGHAHSFAQEYVDGGRHGSGGGIIPAMTEAREIAGIAQHCVKSLPVLRHRVNSRKFRMGEHRDIRTRQLVDAICVYGFELTEVAMRFGWWHQVHSGKAEAKAEGRIDRCIGGYGRGIPRPRHRRAQDRCCQSEVNAQIAKITIPPTLNQESANQWNPSTPKKCLCIAR